MSNNISEHTNCVNIYIYATDTTLFRATDTIRTCYLRIRSPLLYPDELQAQLKKKVQEVYFLHPGCLVGIEPTTTRSTIWRSTAEL